MGIIRQIASNNLQLRQTGVLYHLKKMGESWTEREREREREWERSKV